jgi:hypothetical protein
MAITSTASTLALVLIMIATAIAGVLARSKSKKIVAADVANANKLAFASWTLLAIALGSALSLIVRTNL